MLRAASEGARSGGELGERGNLRFRSIEVVIAVCAVDVDSANGRTPGRRIAIQIRRSASAGAGVHCARAMGDARTPG